MYLNVQQNRKHASIIWVCLLLSMVSTSNGKSGIRPFRSETSELIALSPHISIVFLSGLEQKTIQTIHQSLDLLIQSYLLSIYYMLSNLLPPAYKMLNKTQSSFSKSLQFSGRNTQINMQLQQNGVFQAQQIFLYWVIVCWGVLCTVRYLAASVASTHQMLVAPQPYFTTQSVSKHCQMCPGGKITLLSPMPSLPIGNWGKRVQAIIQLQEGFLTTVAWGYKSFLEEVTFSRRLENIVKFSQMK